MIGCGGTGKSHLIKAVSKWITKIFQRKKDGKPSDGKPKVLLLAYTGAASSLIGKSKKKFIIKSFRFS